MKRNKKNRDLKAKMFVIIAALTMFVILYGLSNSKRFSSTSKATHIDDDLERCPENNDDLRLQRDQPCCQYCVIDRYNGEHITYASQCNNYRTYEWYNKETGDYCKKVHDEKGNNLYMCGEFTCPDGPRKFCLDGNSCQPKEYWYRLQMLVCGRSCPKDCTEHSYLEKCQILCQSPGRCITETNPLNGKKRYFCCQ